MERILVVMVRAPVVSFRRPMDHNYQRTLPMPPPTTLLGIAGAALGLSDRELWAQDSPMRDLRVSVWIEGETGRAYDMWTVLKIKGGRIAERSPYFRELLFSPITPSSMAGGRSSCAVWNGPSRIPFMHSPSVARMS